MKSLELNLPTMDSAQLFFDEATDSAGTPLNTRRNCSRLDVHRHSNPDKFQQILSIPVRQPKAAVRFSAAHHFRTWRAVHSVTRFVQTNPHDADRIVRA